MRDNVQGLGWFVRRSSNTAALGSFYARALSLPVLRAWDTPDSSGTMLYGGDVAAFEINRGGQPPVSDPATAPCTPIFRTRDFDFALRTAEAAGARRIPHADEVSPATAWLCDSAGSLFGLRAADDASPSAPDHLASQRWATGQRGLPELPAMPESIQDIGWVRVRVEDPAKLAAFYAEMLGLDVLEKLPDGAVALHLGGTSTLELCPGGVRRSPPKDRVDITDVWILRLYDYVATKAHFAVNRVHLVNSLELKGGWLDYYVDPEGHLFGFQERKPADPAIAQSNLTEDAAARRVWQAQRISSS
jgi:catechol 2,3-dioxygenase-like lactoylglutathione lyase family enzyme